ncbi:hypothetical protein F5B21DRAFT_506720 [Xylaria acuta]|nr:hypothetical protein F5B21DRAFT_506720 [Xylaria acuta]
MAALKYSILIGMTALRMLCHPNLVILGETDQWSSILTNFLIESREVVGMADAQRLLMGLPRMSGAEDEHVSQLMIFVPNPWNSSTSYSTSPKSQVVPGRSSKMECPYKPGDSAATQQEHSINENRILPIPQPPTHWLIRNLPEMDPPFPLSSIWRLAAVFGDIFKLDLVSRQMVVVSSYELFNEVMDESRFQKSPTGGLKELRALLGDGLFSVYGHEEVTADKSSHGGHNTGDKSPEEKRAGESLLILYGSNAGTCKYLAEDLETTARDRGFNPTVKTMDEGTERLSKDIPVAIITPSYEGMPADNARKFVSWLEAGKSDNLKDVRYAVFGAGNSEWVNTFHRIPKLVDEVMPKLGATRIISPKFVDVKEDLTGPWEDWRDELLVSFSGQSESVTTTTSDLEVTVEKSDTADLLGGETISTGVIRENKQIAGTEVGSAKRHIEVELPEDVTYEPGDYLVVLPTNPLNLVRRAATRFGLNVMDIVTVKGTSKIFLIGRGPSTVIEILGGRVELGTLASKRQIEAIAKTAEGSEQHKLQDLTSSEDVFKSEVIGKRMSVLDIFEDYPGAKLSFAAYLDMLRPLAPRQYSISSSPLATLPGKPVCAAVTYDVHSAPALSGNGRLFEGVASTYLANRTVGSRIPCSVRRSNTGFHLPKDPGTPIIMVAAGTGLAPMRGFIQQRAYIAETNRDVLGAALLYFGCRDFEKDFLYADELREWEGLGAVQVRPAFSRRGPPRAQGKAEYKYTHERMWEERDEIRDLFRQGAKIFVCGSASKLAKSTNEVTKRSWRAAFPDKSEQDAQGWLAGIREVRYVSDVFD